MKNQMTSALILLSLLCCGNLFAQTLWRTVSEDKIPAPGTRYIVPVAYQTYALDEVEVEKALRNAPLENTENASSRPAYFTMPMPDGTFRTFQIVNSPVMAAALGRKYPEIQTYAGFDVEHPGITARFDLTPHGFHAMIFTQEFGTVYIDPYSFRKKGYYIVYRKKDFRPIAGKEFVCGVVGEPIDINDFDEHRMMGTEYGDCVKRTYRFAVAATGEYTAFHGGTQALALAAQVTTMNRVNGVYMREMAIFLEIVPNNDLIVYTDAASDPYTNGTPGSMINEVQTDCDTNIGAANYDVGHVFGTNSGGLAGLGVICSSSKARGVTGSSAPVGDPFDIDYVAHELGHQFGCNHTQNNACNSVSSTSMEPGSASTIMGYAGICAPNVQSNSDDHFHGVSLKEMSNTILATSCPQLTTLSNSSPVINSVTTGLTIPGGTAFAMTADVTDAEGDMLTYCWEQMDPQASTQPPVATSTNGPNFRSNSPVADPTRYFPNLTDYLAGVNPTWEVLSTVTRSFNFRVSVRDNSAAGGCSSYEDATINVDGNSGPFVVQYPSAASITWSVATNETVTWDVAGTNAAPVSCANVDILLSTDGGFTYPVTLATNVPNDGSQEIIVPNNVSTTARVKVVCSDNIFYDISNNNFTIEASNPDFILEANPASLGVCDAATATYVINVLSLLGFADDVTLAVTDLPAGISGAFDVNPVAPGASATLTLSGSAAPGTYAFNVTGTSTTGTKTLSVALEIYEPAPAGVGLTSPADGAVDVSTVTTLSWETGTGTDVVYNLEVSTDAGFGVLVVNEMNLATTSFPVSGLMMNTTYYWRVQASNSCGIGAYSATFSFVTANCQIISSTDVPIAISASGTPLVTSTLTVSGLTTITDINVVEFSGVHTYINDLNVSLASPTGTSISLFSGLCDAEDNFDIQFDDESSNLHTSIPCPPVDGGSYQPNGTLASFVGEDPNGTWTVSIQDAANQDGGALNAWAIEICMSDPAGITLTCPAAATEAACQTQAQVDAAFAAWLETATVSGACTATISHDATVAPDACTGGTATVNFTATGDCGTATCSADFTVESAALNITCPADVSETGIQTQAQIDAAFANWLASATASGGCNTVLTNDGTSAPDANTGGSVMVTFTATGDCSTATCVSTFSYTPTNCQVFSSTDVPVAITEVGTPTITSTLTVSGLTTIEDLNVVALSGTHTYISDLIFDLTSPAGTTVNLMFRVCGGEDNFDIQFDSEATSLYADIPCPPVDGSAYQSNSTLSAFNGEDPNGVWTLTVQDVFDADGGALDAWAIEICTPNQGGLVLTCPPDAVESPCQTQAELDAAFDAWVNLATATGCTNTITYEVLTPRSACAGDDATVIFTATGDCGTATCTAVFTVEAPEPLTVTCPANQVEATGQTQADIDAAFAMWLAGATTTGGCDAILTNDNSGAPDATTGGTATVIFTTADACFTELCTATFTVEPPVDPPCQPSAEIAVTHSAGNVLIEVSGNITSTEIITGTANVEYSAGESIDLGVGFTVDAGAVFHAYILGCQTPAAVGNVEEQKAENAGEQEEEK